MKRFSSAGVRIGALKALVTYRQHFQIPSDHFGVGIMRERAEAVGATLTVESEIGQGTEVVVVWTNTLE